MRILHVAEAMGGGLMEMVLELADGFAARGHEVVIAHGVRPETPDEVRAGSDGIEVRRLHWPRRPDGQLRAARELRSLAGELQPDVVHLHSSFAGVIGVMALGRAAPTVFTPHAFASFLPEGGRATRMFYEAGERFACRRATLVGAVSESEAEVARRLGAERVTHIPNGIRLLDPGRAVTRHSGPNGRPSVVAAGRTVPQRRPDACARILSGVRDLADVAWLGAGGGGRGVEGREALEAAGIELSGWLSRGEVLRRLERATVYLHWTAWDGLPISVLEALALDVVVVAADIPPLRELLGEEGVCTTEEQARERIRAVLADPARAERERERQRALRDEYGAGRMIERWLDVYSDVVGATGRSG